MGSWGESNEGACSPFDRLFENTAYLKLLRLLPWASSAIAEIERACGDEGAAQAAASMLAERNWRPHLVAAVATLFADFDATHLWGAIDRGSWVTPQLLVTAYYVDRDLVANVRARVAGASAKLGASLWQIARWVPELEDVPRIEDSWDRSDEIAADWRDAVVARFAERGRTLSPKWAARSASF
jgi:hypothetical protein